jgi:hypothetical protein
MNEYRYTLEPYKGKSTRHRCPSCQHKGKTFVLYIDTETGELIHPTVGRCNREINCGYHHKPKQYFQENNISIDPYQVRMVQPKHIALPKPISFIPNEAFKASLEGYEANNFVKFLIDRFGEKETTKLVSKYSIGTSKHWGGGSTVFWQMDIQGNVRTGKIMLYNATTGKRVKEPFNHINWAHKIHEKPEFELGQCLFGEHLLIDKTKSVAIVESEKTAVIANVYLPQFIWLATGGLANLNAETCGILKGRNVTLFPDLNGYDKWKRKAENLSHLTSFHVSDLLECKATEQERKQGLDIADYLIMVDLKDFTYMGLEAIVTLAMENYRSK